MKTTAWLLLGLLALGAVTARAEMCESVGEYEYTYGDAESIMSAKQRCENLAIRAAIEQCALFVSSTTNIENYELKDDLVNTLAAALVKQKKVLEQRVEGRTIYYKVSIKLDDEQMTKAIEAERQRRQPAQATQTQAAPAQAAPAQAAPVEKPVATPPAAKPEPARAAQTKPVISSPVDPKHTLAILLGSKAVKKDDWEPLESQGSFGLHFDTPWSGLPLQVTFDFLVSAKSDKIEVFDGWFTYEFDATGVTTELTAGLRYVVPVAGGRVQPYVGAGLGLVGGSFNMKGGGDEVTWAGSTFGFAFEAGVMVPVGPLALGVGLRSSTGEATLEPDDDDYSDIKAAVGGTAFHLVAGFQF
jgi:hypothetical protein